MPIKPLIIATLETALNHYLALDDNAAVFLAPLAGKIIAVTVEPFNETIYLCPTPEKIQCLENFVGQVDTTISGSLIALGLMGLSAKPMRSVHNGEVKIDGDLDVGRKFQELFDKLDLNLEKKLAQFTGENIAHTVSQIFRTGKNWTAETLETFKLNTAEFLQEETRDLPAKSEADIFYRQVDTLRMDYDRLAARVARLQSQLNKETE
jgi:ubiquinone biosynthesis accessory factor UbiJ